MDIYCWNCFSSIYPKTVQTFRNTFLNILFDSTEKQILISFCVYRSKSCASVVCFDSEITFLMEGKDTAFCSSLYWIPFIYGVAKSKTDCGDDNCYIRILTEGRAWM